MVGIVDTIEVKEEAGYIFPEKLVDQNSPTTRHYDALLRGLTHKLNNLLAVIQGFSSLVLMQEELDDMSKENLRHMKEAATTASDLGERVLPAGGCSRIDLTEANLEEAVPMLMNRLKSRVQAEGLDFHARVDPNLPHVIADTDRLRVIMDELVKNALEASGPQDPVIVEVVGPGKAPDRNPKWVSFFVLDRGEAIPENRLRTMFEPFYTTKDSSHMGIGLTTAAVLAGHMGMELGVKSDVEDTSFWLRMKVA